MKIRNLLIRAFALLLPSLAQAQGTLPLALVQQFSFNNCAAFTNACGTPLIGGRLYFYQELISGYRAHPHQPVASCTRLKRQSPKFLPRSCPR
jgi:hypothetical protein